jgi:hypothetical protein
LAPARAGRKGFMKVKDLLAVIQDDETVCIENKEYECLEINGKKYLSNRFMENDVACCFGERYKALCTIGTTIIINIPV